MIHGHQLADAAAGVIADERHMLQLESGHEVGDYPRQPRRREVASGGERELVGAEWPVGSDHAEVLRQARDNVTPQLAVGEKAVHEQHGLPGAELAVADGSLG